MSNEEQNWLSDTRKVVKSGGGCLAININKNVCEALGLKVGSLIEVKIRNTGTVIETRTRLSKEDKEHLDKKQEIEEITRVGV